ncbi:hypothetical protein [Piscinibacter gummiphilus]|uniref:DUF4388 domain-containing protein n=1 Tax=Piscinibacter gummiphilus TaxID=946333 RepID=A0ABZ0D129_9BURK|nr:hypothetical protein [Piscinibacter gummiphilus]WOB10850.1 hypothetical protein RXV79_12535 [Piscinibacter gummiphilus]
MFVAHESFEDPMMSALAGDGEHCFRAMHLSIRAPWFIVTCLVSGDDVEMLRSVCCSWDVDLRELLRVDGGRRPVSVQQMTPSHEGDGRWEARQIERVWTVEQSVGHSVLVFQDFEGNEFTNTLDQKAEEPKGERTLLFGALPAMPRGRRTSSRPEPRTKLPLFDGEADPFAAVSAAQLAAQLRITVEEVRHRAAAGELFAVGPAVSGEQRFPSYQSLPALAGDKLGQLLAVLAQSDGHPQLFFAGECPELGLLSPVEVLLGAAIKQRGFEPVAASIIAADPEARFEYVLDAARAYVAATSGW